jgi:hypothetical protein
MCMTVYTGLVLHIHTLYRFNFQDLFVDWCLITRQHKTVNLCYDDLFVDWCLITRQHRTVNLCHDDFPYEPTIDSYKI